MTEDDDAREAERKRIDPDGRYERLFEDLRPYRQFEGATGDDIVNLLLGAPQDFGPHLAGVKVGRVYLDLTVVFEMVLRSIITGGADLTSEELRERMRRGLEASEENRQRVIDVFLLISYMSRHAHAKFDSAMRELYMEGIRYAHLRDAPASERSEKAVRRRVSDLRAQESDAAVARLTDPARAALSTRQSKPRGHKSEWDAVSLELAIRSAVTSLRSCPAAKIDYDRVADEIRRQTKKVTPGTADSLRSMVRDFRLNWKELKSGV